MIELKNVFKRFAEKVVLQDVSAEMFPGKTNLIIGTSGSGKTVLMKIMIGLVKADQGEVLFAGKDLNKMSEEELRKLRNQIGMLFQGSALFDSKTVQENVLFPLDMFTNLTRREKLRKVNEVLERVKIKDANRKFPAEISGGMKKRVALARAIVLNPKFLFCDEPNSGLDPQTSLTIDHLITEITREFNTTTVINTHDMTTVMESGDNIIFLHQGKKRWQGSSEEIVQSEDEDLNNFIFASKFLQKAKEMQVLEAEVGEAEAKEIVKDPTLVVPKKKGLW
jgi:phospholipid/cholesterol/gamma-HCH transport system ATP-binding protein